MPKARVDGEQIRRVIINLVDNAIEAMNRSGLITIETQHDPGATLVRLTVSDNGPGIPLAEREKLFMPYYSTKRRGSGLGLAIVRRIVKAHGGEITVAGEPEVDAVPLRRVQRGDVVTRDKSVPQCRCFCAFAARWKEL